MRRPGACQYHGSSGLPPARRFTRSWALCVRSAPSRSSWLIFGFHWFTYRASNSITDDAFVEAHIVNVAPEMVSGRIVRFLVEENDHVKQGQVLAEIEPVHYRDQVEQAKVNWNLPKRS